MSEIKDSNKDEVNVDKSSPEKEAKSIVKQAQAQAKKIIQNATLEAKKIVAAAVEEAGEEEGGNNTIGKKWMYDKDGNAQIFNADEKPKGWSDEPPKK